MAKTRIILNPISGRRTAPLHIPEIEQEFQKLGVEYDLIQTQHVWHAAELAFEAVQQGCQNIIAAGGDGTCNEVLNGLMLARNVGLNHFKMGVLPVGQGNDFPFSMGIPLNLSESCKVIANGYTKTIDIGKVTGGEFPNGRFFGNGVGIGFDAAVGFLAAKMKRLRGFAAYAVAAVQAAFFYYKAPLVEINYDDSTVTQPALMVSIMNGRRMGGGFMLAPDGIPDDGLFDLTIADQVSRPKIFAMIPKFMAGTQAGDPAVHLARAKRIQVRAMQGVLPCHADGETICTHGTEITIELLPAQLELLLPQPNA